MEGDGSALLTEKIASKVWTTMTWAVYEVDVPTLRALRSIFGARGGEAEPLGAWRGTPVTLLVGSIKLDSTSEEYSGTHRWKDGPAKGTIG